MERHSIACQKQTGGAEVYFFLILETAILPRSDIGSNNVESTLSSQIVRSRAPFDVRCMEQVNGT